MPRSKGGIFNLVGQGVGLVAEYRQHRQSQQTSREDSQQLHRPDVSEVPVDAGPSTRASHQPPTNHPAPDELPPSYDQVANIQLRPENAPAQDLPLSHDEKKHSGASSHDLVPDSFDLHDHTFLIQDDEECWALDEAVPQPDSKLTSPLRSRESEASYQNDDEGLVQDPVTSGQDYAVQSVPRDPLPCPVIIPQRRPGSRARGFVRAYAPVLEDCGISQEAFLKFLKDFDKSSQASPIFTVISISAAIAGFVPSVTAMIVATVVQTAAQVGAQVQGRKRTNDCLDRMNEEIFRPAGLFVFIMKYKSDQPSSTSAGGVSNLVSHFGIRSQTVDLSTNQIIAKYNPTIDPAAATEHSNLSRQLQRLRLVSGTTQGNAALPVSAPLIFPDIDAAARQDGDEAFKDKAKDAKKFLAGYLDRRAQNKYAESDPDSRLVLPEEQRAFKSQYADPNHPMFNNGLVGFVSGGKLARDQAMRPDIRQGRLGARRSRHGDDRYAYEDEASVRHSGRGYGGRRGRSGGLIGGLVGLASNAIANRGSESSGPIPPRVPASATSYGESRVLDSQVNSSVELQSKDSYHDHTGVLSHGDGSRSDDGQGTQVGRPDRARGSARQGRRGGPLGMVKKAMKEDVLYLMIVNMPSDSELEEARQALGMLHSS